MGENCAGKSTLMKILTGVYQPDGGKIRVDEYTVGVSGAQTAQARGISLIHRELFLMNHLTAAQNISSDASRAGASGFSSMRASSSWTSRPRR